jgi:hypothetical protein
MSSATPDLIVGGTGHDHDNVLRPRPRRPQRSQGSQMSRLTAMDADGSLAAPLENGTASGMTR